MSTTLAFRFLSAWMVPAILVCIAMAPASDAVGQVPDETSARALLDRGIDYYLGIGGKVDLPQAVEFFARAAQTGDPLARAWHARLFLHERADVPEDRPRAEREAAEVVERVKALADEGDREALFLLASMHEDGVCVEEDLVRARALYEQAAAKGHPLAYANLAWLTRLGEGGRRDPVRAFELFNQAVQAGDRHAIRQLGVMYYHGIGVAEDPIQARHWFLEAAKFGDPVAYYNLGLMNEGGQGGPPDPAEAVRYYRLGVERGELECAFRLGVVHYRGLLGERNFAAAIRWFHFAARHGHPVAMYNLGSMVSEGWGTRADPEIAKRWFRRSAERGYVNSMRVLAETAWRANDETEAVRWMTAAADAGHRETAGQLAEYYADLAERQTAEGIDGSDAHERANHYRELSERPPERRRWRQ